MLPISKIQVMIKVIFGHFCALPLKTDGFILNCKNCKKVC